MQKLFHRYDFSNRPERTVLGEPTNPTMPYLIANYPRAVMIGELKILSFNPHLKPGHFSRHKSPVI